MARIAKALTASKLLRRWPLRALVPRGIAFHAAPIEVEIVGRVDTGSVPWLKMVLDEMGFAARLVFVPKTVGTDGLKVAVNPCDWACGRRSWMASRSGSSSDS